MRARSFSFFRTRFKAGLLGAGVCASALALLPVAAQAATPGTLDASFGAGGIAPAQAGIRFFGAAVQSDGKTLATGAAGGTLIVARFTTGGQLDGSFGSGGIAHSPAITGTLDTGSLGRSVAVQSDGKIVVAGKVTSADDSSTDAILIERFNSNGSIDGSFGSGGVVKAATTAQGDGYGVAIQSDGKIVAVGSANAVGQGGSAPRVAVVRLNTNGSPDSGFRGGGTDILDFGAYSVAQTVALQSDGKIVIAGSQAPGLQVPNALIARLTTAGNPDPTFASGGAFAHQYAIGAASSSFNGLAIQSDGKIVAAGAATAANNTADAFFVRFTTGGAQDGSFGSGGVTYAPSAVNWVVNGAIPGVYGLALAGNGDIIGVGTIASATVRSAAVWALRSNGQFDTSFGNHGATVTSAGGSTSAEGNGVAIGADGNVVAVGDTRTLIGQTYSSLAARYVGFGGVTPPPPPTLTASFSGVKGSYKTSSVTKSGLKISVSCNEACSLKGTLGISAGTARKLKLKSTITKCTKKHGKKHCVKTKGYKALTIASASKSIAGAGTGSLTLKIKGSFANALKKQKRVSVTLKVVATSTSTHKTKTIKKGLTFKR
jgi:uncharacterized delta-60 repeat protein